MIQLTDAQVQKFIAIYKRRFGESLSQDDARAMATNLVELVMLATRLTTAQSK